MTNRTRSGRKALFPSTVFPLCLGLSLALSGCAPDSREASQDVTVSATATDPMSDSAENVRLIGYNDLQGRQSLQVTARSNPANGNWLYVGHQPNVRPNSDEPLNNPITGRSEISGTSLIDITAPDDPRTVWHIPGISKANHRSVSVVYDYAHDSSGRDYLVRSSDTGDDFRFQIFDITSRDSDPEQIRLVAEITGTPPNSCGPGCGGPFIFRAHKGYWSEESGFYYTSSGEPGFRNTLLHIWDLRDPTTPSFVGRAWSPGMKDTEDESLYQGQYVHHPVVDEANNRVYIGFRNTSGLAGAWDISDRANPTPVWAYDTKPAGRGPHTITPIVYDELPNFHGNALPRTYALVTDEASSDDMAPCTNGVRAKLYMFDLTAETHPMPVSTWQVPNGEFCKKGGRFGPHQHAEFVNGRLNRHENRLAWVAYFNAGVRVVDVSDPYRLKELGHYIPKPNENSHPMSDGQPAVIQVNDVTIDHRGLAYLTDRVGTGLFVMEYTGPMPGAQ